MSRAIPPEMCLRIKRLCAVHTHEVVAELTGVSLSSITNLKGRGFEPRQIGRQRSPMPSDFQIQANHMTIPDLMTHYRVAASTLHGWLKQIDRQYTPRPAPDKSTPLIRRDKILAAISSVGVTRAHEVLGISANTLRKMRDHYGMTVKRRRSPKKLRIVETAKAERALGWTDRYFERRAA